jgi:hypothetical protein
MSVKSTACKLPSAATHGFRSLSAHASAFIFACCRPSGERDAFHPLFIGSARMSEGNAKRATAPFSIRSAYIILISTTWGGISQ